MGNCFATSHAEGIVSCLAAKQRIVAREVAVNKIQEALRTDEVDLDFGGQEQD